MEKSDGLQVILFPLPLQGCINPMIQLAKILHSRSFSITMIHTRFNAPRASSHPLFKLLQIPDGLSDTETRAHDVNLMLTVLNERCESPFRDCLTKLLQSPDAETEEEKQRISCLIHDSGWIFTEPLAKSLNLPRFVLNATKVSFFRGHFALPQLRRERYLPLQDSEQEDPVQEFPPLRKKDVYRLLDEESEVLDAYLNGIYDTTKSSSVLRHRAIGGYLTHNGWNSTVESICEGIPMICLPFIWDQFLNARFVCDIWRVGLHLENLIERNEIESSIRSLFLGNEGEAIRERMRLLQGKVGRSVKENGSAYQSLESLIGHISSF
ncbi:UDP-glycosyltransferase 76C3 [Raphanus sativus]|nr:UDP-glycosyltransferase 76C3 [Raphanus sativus]